MIFAIGFDMAGLESLGDFIMNKLLLFSIYAAPAVGLILGMLGQLPGTKGGNLFLPAAHPEAHWTTKSVQYLILRIGLFFFFALITFPAAVAAIWVVNHYNANSESILIIPVLAYYFGLVWFSNATAKHMTFSNQTLFSATKTAIVDLRIRLAFIPLIGRWFAPDDNGVNKKQDS